MGGPLDHELTRRRFLAWSGLAGTATILAACMPAPTPSVAPLVTPSPSPAPPLGFFDALTELRDALRTSPDHLLAEAERLVATRDPEAILAFVRSSIATYPAGRRSLGDLVQGRRWGTQATLRGGAGTPREKADLLADLYARAGFEAEVVRRDVQRLAPALLLRRPPVPAFEPAIDPVRLAELREVLGLAPQAEPADPLDVDGAESSALADAILATLGEAPEVREPFELPAVRELPAVALTLPSGRVIADPFGAGALEPLSAGDASSAGTADDALEVRVRVEAARSTAPDARFPLVEGNWSAEDLVGRSVHVSFPPPVETLEELLLVRPRDVQVVQPMLCVRGVDLPIEQSRELSVAGDAITLGGDVVGIDASDGVVTVGSNQVGLPDPDPARLAAVRSIEVEANAAAFPNVTLLARVLDAAGAPVEGLPATAFSLADDGAHVGFGLQHAIAPAPRVLILLDDSGSLPDDFRDAGAGVVARRLAERLRSEDDRVQLRVAVVDGVEADPVGDWTADPTEIERAAARASGLGSQLWEALADAARLGPTAIVYVTDGAATDGNDEIATPPTGYPARVRAGPPAVVVGVGEVRPAMLAALGEAGGLGSFTVAAQDEAVDAVAGALGAHAASAYRFRYRAPLEGAEERTATVQLRQADGSLGVSGSGTYTVPPPDERAVPATLSGLFVSVRVGTLEVERTLAGLATDDDRAEVSADVAEAVRRALFGTAVLEFEGAAPPAPVVLDDLLSSLLTLRPLFEATDQAGRLAALAAGPLVLPSTYGVLSVALPSGDSETLTFETGLRVTLHRATEVPAGEGRARRTRSVDALPHTRFASAVADPREAFRVTSRRSARIAIVEGAAFDSSTQSALLDEGLVPIGLSLFSTLGDVDPALVQALAAALAPWAPIRPLGLVPADGSPAAAWLLDPESGSVWGVLGDGSGGGSEVDEINDTFDNAERILAGAGVVSDISSLAGVGGFGLAAGVWAQLEATKLKKLRAATLMLATLVPPEGDIADLSGLACGLAQTLAFDGAGRVAGRLAGAAGTRAVTLGSLADGTSSLVTGSGLFC